MIIELAHTPPTPGRRTVGPLEVTPAGQHRPEQASLPPIKGVTVQVLSHLFKNYGLLSSPDRVRQVDRIYRMYGIGADRKSWESC